MTKSAKSSNAANHSKQDYSAAGVGYREIGIAAVAAAVRCQHMALPDDERTDLHPHDLFKRSPALIHPDEPKRVRRDRPVRAATHPLNGRATAARPGA